MTNEISLGHINLKANPVKECGDCHSRNVVDVPGEVSKEAVSEFIRTRAGRLNVNLDNYEVHVDKTTGAVTATPKPHQQLEFDFS